VIRYCLSEHQVGILFVLPFLITAATSSVWPVAEVIWLAYYQYDRLRYDAQF
jgi:ABC-type sugar transport system permease subunit